MKRSNLISLLAMGAFHSSMEIKSREQLARESSRPEPADVPKPDTISIRLANLNVKLQEYLDSMSARKVTKTFTVQGFENVPAINQKNATKAMRKILGETMHDPNMTKAIIDALIINHQNTNQDAH